MPHPRLPELDAGGFKSFPFRLALDEQGTPMIISDDIVRMYLGYCMRCKLERSEPENFHGWLYAADSALLPDTESAPEAGA